LVVFFAVGIFVAGCADKKHPGFATRADEAVFAAEFYDRLKAGRLFRDRPLRLGRDLKMAPEHAKFIDRYINLMTHNDMRLHTPSAIIAVSVDLVERLRDRNIYTVRVALLDNGEFIYTGNPVLMSETDQVTCAPRKGTLWFFCHEFLFTSTSRMLMLRM